MGTVLHSPECMCTRRMIPACLTSALPLWWFYASEVQCAKSPIPDVCLFVLPSRHVYVDVLEVSDF